MAVNVAWLASNAGAKLDAPNSPLGAFAPLWKDAQGFALSIDDSKGTALNAVATCKSADGSKRVAETLQSVIVMAKNGVEQIKDGLAKQPADARANMPEAVQDYLTKGIDPLLTSAKVTQNGKTVQLKAATSFDFAASALSFFPPFNPPEKRQDALRAPTT